MAHLECSSLFYCGTSGYCYDNHCCDPERPDCSQYSCESAYFATCCQDLQMCEDPAPDVTAPMIQACIDDMEGSRCNERECIDSCFTLCDEVYSPGDLCDESMFGC